ncbi:MAG: transketolase C-terminal domain-containing protein, partial [Gemmatimonadota bacterium]
HEGLRPYGGTFLIFSDYMRPTIRLAALMKQPVIYVFTHDSVGVGEDGPTHQPIEHLASLRAVPNLFLIRPADGAETAGAWRVALERDGGPTALALTRQKVPQLERSGLSAEEGVLRGGYVLADLPEDAGATARPDLILIATGSEVHVALEAGRRLAGEDLRVRVVSLPCWELFEAQPEDYRAEVLPRDVTARVSVEAGSPLGWERYVGRDGVIVGIDRFGASAPGDVVLEKLSFNPENVVRQARKLLRRGVEADAAGSAERRSPAGHAGGKGTRNPGSSGKGGTGEADHGNGSSRGRARRR